MLLDMLRKSCPILVIRTSTSHDDMMHSVMLFMTTALVSPIKISHTNSTFNDDVFVVFPGIFGFL